VESKIPDYSCVSIHDSGENDPPHNAMYYGKICITRHCHFLSLILGEFLASEASRENFGIFDVLNIQFFQGKLNFPQGMLGFQ